VSLSEANSFLLLQLPRSRTIAKQEKKGKSVEALSAPGARGHGQEFTHGAAGLAAGDIRAGAETPPSWCYLLRGSGLFSRVRLSTSLVPSHMGLCHPRVWELVLKPWRMLYLWQSSDYGKKNKSKKAKQTELLAAAAVAHLAHTCNKSKLAESFPFHPNKTNNKEGLRAESGVFSTV